MFYFFSKLLHFLLDPTFYFWVMGVIFFYGHIVKKSQHSFYRKLVLFFTFYLILLLSPLSSFPLKILEEYKNDGKYVLSEKSIKPSVGIILGGGILAYKKNEKEGYFFSATIDRLMKALELYRDKKIDKIVVSGGDPGGIPDWAQGEAASLILWLVKWGVPR